MTPEQTCLIEQHIDVAESIAHSVKKRTADWLDHDDLLGPALESLTVLAMRYDPRIGTFSGYLRKELPRDLIDETRRIFKRSEHVKMFSLEHGGIDDQPHGQYRPHDDLINRIDSEQQRRWVEDNLWRLTDREQSVVSGLLVGMGCVEIASLMRIGQPRVSQLRTSAIAKLKAALSA